MLLPYEWWGRGVASSQILCPLGAAPFLQYLVSSVGFLPSRKVFLPCQGEKYPDVFILRCSTITTCKPEYICTAIQINY